MKNCKSQVRNSAKRVQPSCSSIFIVGLKTFSPRVHSFSKLNPRFAFQSCQSALLRVSCHWHLALQIIWLWRQAFSIVRWSLGKSAWTAPSPKRKSSLFKLHIKPDALLLSRWPCTANTVAAFMVLQLNIDQ